MDDHNEEIDAKENRRELATETTSDQGIVISSVTSIANKVGQEKKSLQMEPPKNRSINPLEVVFRSTMPFQMPLLTFTQEDDKDEITTIMDDVETARHLT